MAGERVELRMPNVGNGVESAVVDAWVVEVGEQVRTGEAVVTVETDKASSDLEAPVSGTLVEIVADDGAEVEVGDLIGVFEAAAASG